MNEINLDYKKDFIKSKIFTFRDTQVMVDKDLAELYNVETKSLNQAVKRNINRFPDLFRFQLNDIEKNELVTNCDRFKSLKHSSYNPYVFTEQGIAMLSAVLKSNIAANLSVQIITAFVEMRKIILSNNILYSKIANLENKQLENEKNFSYIFNSMENYNFPTQGIFLNGQIFDAYYLINKIIKSANKSIIIIDNYIDENVLFILSKKSKNVNITILTKNINQQLKLDVVKFNEQYGKLTIKNYTKSHDRFIIIDNEEFYHLGASIKDLGKQIFAITKLNKDSIEILKGLNLQ